MKTLRTLIRLDAVLLALLGFLTATYTYSVTVTRSGEVYRFDQERAPLLFLGTAVVVLAIVLYRVGDFALIGHRRRLGNLLAAGNLGIAVVVIVAQPSDWDRVLGGIPPLVLLIMAMALAWTSRRSMGPDDAAAELAALQIPDDIREALRRQIGEAAAQEERNRLARDLHDSIKQQLFTINVSTAAAQERWERDPEGARAMLADVRRSAKEAMVEMQALLHQLRPEALGSVKGLIEALREQCEALGYRSGSQVTVELGEEVPDDRLPPGAQEALFRIAQEALANVARHARAQNVRIWLGREGESALLRVEDDGQGFNSGEKTSGMGLRNLRERAESVRGTVEVRSTPGSGTTVKVGIPLIPPPVPEKSLIEQEIEYQKWPSLLFWGQLLLAVIALVRWPALIVETASRRPTRGVALFLVFFLVAVVSGWRARRALRSSPGATPEAVFRLRYLSHRNRSVCLAAAAWMAPWTWRFDQPEWLPWVIAWMAVSVICAGLALIELAKLHEVSQPRLGLTTRQWFASFVFLTMVVLSLLWVYWVEARPPLAHILYILLAAAILEYLLTRGPRKEGVTA